jgi:hypothetical protein
LRFLCPREKIIKKIHSFSITGVEIKMNRNLKSFNLVFVCVLNE